MQDGTLRSLGRVRVARRPDPSAERRTVNGFRRDLRLPERAIGLLSSIRMQLRVLLLEEENSKKWTLRRFLEFRGCRVDCAHELEEAEALLANFTYHIVVSDVRLSAVHGCEGLRVLSYAHDQSPTTRTVMLAGRGYADVEEEARNRGIEIIERREISCLLKAAS